MMMKGNDFNVNITEYKLNIRQLSLAHSAKVNKKLIRRWDSERELSVRRHNRTPCSENTEFDSFGGRLRHSGCTWT